MIKKIAGYTLSVLLGLVFIYSAYTKIAFIEPFEWNFVELGLANWTVAPILSRLFVGLEFFLGAMLILQVALRRFTYKAVAGLLVVFSLYLLWQIIASGNKGNCGCFGEMVKMTPLEGILKNVVMLVIVLVLAKIHDGIKWKEQGYIFFLLLAAAFATPFIMNPLNYAVIKTHKKEAVGYKARYEPLYDMHVLDQSKIDLGKGKHVVAFLSLTCPHCRKAAYKMHIMYDRNPQLPFLMVLNGDSTDLKPFFEETKAQKIPHVMFNEGPKFIDMASLSLPSLQWWDNGIVVRKPNYFELKQDEIEAWIISK